MTGNKEDMGQNHEQVGGKKQHYFQLFNFTTCHIQM